MELIPPQALKCTPQNAIRLLALGLIDRKPQEYDAIAPRSEKKPLDF